MKRSPLKPCAPLKRKPPSLTGLLSVQSYQRLAVAEPKRRTRKCALKTCRKPFQPCSMTHVACSTECAIEVVRLKREAKDRKDRQAGLVKLKPRKWWLAKAKTALHALVRARDEGKECASCDTILVRLGRVGGDYDAGHFRSVGSAKHLEFDLRNIWGQCKHCNDYLAGNAQEYERRLRLRQGDAFVDGLLADKEPRHLTIADFQEIEAWAKAELKKLKAAASASE